MTVAQVMLNKEAGPATRLRVVVLATPKETLDDLVRVTPVANLVEIILVKVQISLVMAAPPSLKVKEAATNTSVLVVAAHRPVTSIRPAAPAFQAARQDEMTQPAQRPRAIPRKCMFADPCHAALTISSMGGAYTRAEGLNR